jgi:hypothetical protein
MSTDWHIVTFLSLKPLKQQLFDVTSFKILKSLYPQSVLFKCTKSFGPVFPIVWIVELRDQIADPRQLSFFHFLFVTSF